MQGIDVLEDHVASVSHFPEDSGPDVFRLFFINDADSNPLYCALHRNEENEKMLILEFVREDKSIQRPAYVISDREKNQDDLDEKAKRRCAELSDALQKFLNEGNFDSMLSSFYIMDKMEAYFASMTDIKSLADELARIVRQLIAFDRVVVYQFDEEWNGECISESINPLISDIEPFYGLHFPASDIPPQARKLYARNKVFHIFEATNNLEYYVGIHGI